MENYSVQVPPYTVGPEAYKKIEKQCHISVSYTHLFDVYSLSEKFKKEFWKS